MKLERDGNEAYKRFVVFAHDMYYPMGAFGDVFDEADTLKQAEAMAIIAQSSHEFIEVFDRVEGFTYSLV